MSAPAAPGFCAWCGAAYTATNGPAWPRTCAACGETVYLDPKVAVGMVLEWQGGVLLGLRAIDPGKGRWSFPAGYVDRGEKLEEAVVREVAEELGVQARVARLVGVYSRRDDPVILVVYEGDVVCGEPRPDGVEVLDVRSFPPDRLPELAFTHDATIIADWATRHAFGVAGGRGA